MLHLHQYKLIFLAFFCRLGIIVVIMLDRSFCIAPMMDYTDRHCRYLLRLISQNTLLYTEMVTMNAIIHGPRERLLHYNPAEHPIALQIGGSEPAVLADCAKIAEDYQYDEINLNVGCPSDRVQSGRFGACLMAEPQRVADCVAAMQHAVRMPITVKTRIGIDDQDSYEALKHFIQTIQAAGCQTFIIHARKAWLKGLSPKENREIPPLRYEVVYQLKRDFPQLEIIINGGIQTLEQASEHLKQVDGVMLGRAAYHDPYILAQIDKIIFGLNKESPTREAILAAYVAYIEQELSKGVPLNQMTRHILGLFQGFPGARKWRRYISESVSDREKKVILLQTLKKPEKLSNFASF